MANLIVARTAVKSGTSRYRPFLLFHSQRWTELFLFFSRSLKRSLFLSLQTLKQKVLDGLSIVIALAVFTVAGSD